MRYADVIVPLAVEGLFTYAVPDTLKDKVEAGTLVLAAFAGNRRYTALVVRVHGEQPDGYTVRMLEGVVVRSGMSACRASSLPCEGLETVMSSGCTCLLRASPRVMALPMLPAPMMAIFISSSYFKLCLQR